MRDFSSEGILPTEYKRILRAVLYRKSVTLLHSQKLNERNAKGVGDFIENGNVGTGSALLPFGDRLRCYADSGCQVILSKPRVFSRVSDLPAQIVCVYHLLTPCAIREGMSLQKAYPLFGDKSPQRASTEQVLTYSVFRPTPRRVCSIHSVLKIIKFASFS